jgi:hypothetical protein
MDLYVVLADLGVETERVDAGAYLVTLAAGRSVWLLEGEQAVTVEAFVLHVLPGADAAALHRHLLFRNRLMRGAHYALDEVGDVFLCGSLTRVSPQSVDRLLGELWQTLSEDLDRLLALAYGTDVPEKALLDGAGRRMAGTPDWAPRRDARR